MSKLLTQAAFAKQIKVSPSRINHLVKAGIINLVVGKVNPEQALDAIAKAEHPSYAKGPGRPVSGTPTEGRYAAQTDYALARAKLAWLDYETKKGKLIDVAIAKNEWGMVIMVIVARLEALPSKVAPLCVNQSVAEIAAIMQERIDELRTELFSPGNMRAIIKADKKKVRKKKARAKK